MTPRILVAADGTPAGSGALRMAVRLAEREHARVEVLAVYDPAGPRIVGGADSAPTLDSPGAREGARALLERVRAQVAALGGAAEDWSVSVEVGRMPRTVASAAAARGASRVVLGLSQASSAERWMAREMLLDLIRRLQVPVMAVPPGYGELPRSVIVAVDFSRYSLEIAREALEDLEPGAQLHLVNVASHPRGAGDRRTSRISPSERLGLERRMMELASELEIPEVAAVETHLLSGDPAEEILRLAQVLGTEMIAAGSHGASYPGQLLTGDVYGKLVHEASCSLLIGPPRGMRIGVAGSPGEVPWLEPILA